MHAERIEADVLVIGGGDINTEALARVRRELLGLDGAMIDDTEAPAILIRGSRWSAFVRLREERLAALEAEGVLIARDVPGIDRAYRLVD